MTRTLSRAGISAAVLALVVASAGCARAPTPESPAGDNIPAGAVEGPAAPAGPAASPGGTPAAAPNEAATATGNDPAVAEWCASVRESVRDLKWGGLDPCPAGVQWQAGGRSVDGRPLVFAEFGDPGSVNTTLIMTMVHGDEITPLYLGVELVHWMVVHHALYEKAHVVIAPLVNPDGFYRRPRTRMNAHGVDVNRNFPTHDWDAHALRAWKIRYRSDPRRFPGPASGSEPETVFQENLIHRFKPQKILSVHAPLNHLDYDGPTPLSLKTFPREYVQECLKLRKRLKAISTGFFPGSLGNYAGQEMGIPTLTLELPTANPRMAAAYWSRFKEGIDTMIEFIVPPPYAFGGSRTAPTS